MPVENIFIKIRKQFYAVEHSVSFYMFCIEYIQKSNIVNEVLRYRNIRKYSLIHIL